MHSTDLLIRRVPAD